MREYCPKCRQIQNLDEKKSNRKDKIDTGKEIRIVTKSYYCQVCHTFIRSEETKSEPGKKPKK